MRTFLYALETALKSLWHEKWINFLTILSVSIGLLILSTFMTISQNLDSVLKRWSKDFGLVVYLRDSAGHEEEKALRNLFMKDPDITDVRYVSREAAIQQLRGVLGDHGSVLDDFEDDLLPSSFELTIRRELLDPAFVEHKANEIKLLNGVGEVQYGEKWLSSLNTLSNIMKAAVYFLGSAIFIAITFITYTTIKIFFYRRKEEIETLKLLGATRTFVRLPFVLEGLFIGIIAGAVSTFGLFGVYSFIIHKIAMFIPSISIVMVPLSPETYAPAPLAGALMSFLGSLIAVGKIRY